VGVAAQPAALAACTSPDPTGSTPTPTSTPDPDRPVVLAAAEAERHLLAVYTATMTRHPDLRQRLAAFAEHHRHHLGQLTARVRPGTAHATSIASASPSPGSPGAESPGPDAAGPDGAEVPATAEEALQALVAAERQAAEARTENVGAARDGDLARLLASIGACEATHASDLGGESA
jgi:hypothetical protein